MTPTTTVGLFRTTGIQTGAGRRTIRARFRHRPGRAPVMSIVRSHALSRIALVCGMTKPRYRSTTNGQIRSAPAQVGSRIMTTASAPRNATAENNHVGCVYCSWLLAAGCFEISVLFIVCSYCCRPATFLTEPLRLHRTTYGIIVIPLSLSGSSRMAVLSSTTRLC